MNVHTESIDIPLLYGICLKKNQTTPRPSEHPPVMGEKMSKRLGGIKRLLCYKYDCHWSGITTTEELSSRGVLTDTVSVGERCHRNRLQQEDSSFQIDYCCRDTASSVVNKGLRQEIS